MAMALRKHLKSSPLLPSVHHISGTYVAFPTNSYPLFSVLEFAMAVSFPHTFSCYNFPCFFKSTAVRTVDDHF